MDGIARDLMYLHEDSRLKNNPPRSEVCQHIARRSYVPFFPPLFQPWLQILGRGGIHGLDRDRGAGAPSPPIDLPLSYQLGQTICNWFERSTDVPFCRDSVILITLPSTFWYKIIVLLICMFLNAVSLVTWGRNTSCMAFSLSSLVLSRKLL